MGLSALLLAGCLGIDLELEFVQDAEIHRRILDQTSDHFPEIDPLFISDEVRQFVD